MASDEESQAFHQIKEEAQNKLNEVVEDVLRTAEYNAASVPEWTSIICQQSINTLTSISKTFKYTATCFIIQKTDGGVTMNTASFWDPDMDGHCSIRWENSSLLCYVLVFACSL
mmetsp:Transcript_1974/g.2706  ORF Transcript_1974/g.2706 Transcript_1974/m.2706 type:complete len:114 (-) Transcript_1974:209-550(-)